MSSHQPEPPLTASLGELFPELCGAPVDLEGHAASVIMRALNDGSPRVREHVIDHYGLERVKRIAHARADRLSNRIPCVARAAGPSASCAGRHFRAGTLAKVR